MEREQIESLRQEHLDAALERLAATIRASGPERVARHAAVSYEGDTTCGTFKVPLWGQAFSVTYPGLDVLGPGGEPAGGFERGLLLFYLGAEPVAASADEGWVSLRQLPGGQFYASAYQGYSGDVLADRIGHDPEALSAAAMALGGRPEPVGDVGFSFEALPQVRVAVFMWRGDSEFPASASVLFDSCSRHHLPTDVLAGLGSRLVRRLLEQIGC